MENQNPIYEYKLVYESEEIAISDLFSRGILIKEEGYTVYGKGVYSVVYLPIIILEYGTYDSAGKEITPPIIAEGFHCDIVSQIEFVFENEIFPKEPRHKFMWEYKN